MPAASASSRVVVPPKPFRANSGIAASTILCRRLSLSSRVAAMMRKSKRSLTWGQDTGLRQKRWPKKMAKKRWAASPRRPPNQRCGNGRLPPYPTGMRATRRREGPASRPAAQPRNPRSTGLSTTIVTCARCRPNDPQPYAHSGYGCRAFGASIPSSRAAFSPRIARRAASSSRFAPSIKPIGSTSPISAG